MFQLVTNNVKIQNALNTAQDYDKLIKHTQTRMPSTKILISQAPNNADAPHSARVSATNHNLTDMYRGSAVTCISNDNIRSFGADKVDLTKHGSSALTHNIKYAVYNPSS